MNGPIGEKNKITIHDKNKLFRAKSGATIQEPTIVVI